MDWQGLADPDTTLVIYMGMANIAQIAVRLISQGLSETTPVAAVCNGTRPDERCLISTLGEIAGAVADAGIDGPTLFYIGQVVELAVVLAPGRVSDCRVPGRPSSDGRTTDHPGAVPHARRA